jgi:NAD(P)-dependent dehydrogenase (short-subunit alcohol dehydrogenase family)
MKKSVLITGTSSGYGKATAQLFLDRGWNVVATMRQPNQAIFHGPADRLRVLPLDVTDPDSINKAITGGIAAFGAIDAIVNNAGIGLLSAFEVTSESVMREIFETNTFGLMSVCRAVIPHMRERGKGVIINVTSSAGIAPMPLVAIYTASKCAVEGFSEALSYEMGLLGIKVRLVEPGLAPTTNLGANGTGRMQGLTPPPYDAFAQDYMAKMQNYPTAYTTEEETAEAVFSAATDDGDRLRYPVGEDTKLFSALRWTTSEEEYLAKMRKMFGPNTQP